MKKNDATVSSLDWITYSSYVDGPCWMKYVDDNKFLDELNIPGTHDSGTCSVDNDTEPQSSQVKCQQDYIPTQLLEGIRYLISDSERATTPVSATGISTYSKRRVLSASLRCHRVL